MNFLGIGTGELLMIFLVAVLVVGPEKLVEFAGKLGRTIGRLRKMLDQANAEFGDVTKEVKQVMDLASGASQEVMAEVQGVAQQLDTTSTGVASSPASTLAATGLAEAASSSPENLAAYEAGQMQGRLVASLVDGEVTVESVPTLDTPANLELEEDPAAQVEPLDVLVTQVVTDDEHAEAFVATEVLLIADSQPEAAATEEPSPAIVLTSPATLTSEG